MFHWRKCPWKCCLQNGGILFGPQCVKHCMQQCVISTVHVDGPALICARPSAGTTLFLELFFTYLTNIMHHIHSCVKFSTNCLDILQNISAMSGVFHTHWLNGDMSMYYVRGLTQEVSTHLALGQDDLDGVYSQYFVASFIQRTQKRRLMPRPYGLGMGHLYLVHGLKFQLFFNYHVVFNIMSCIRSL